MENVQLELKYCQGCGTLRLQVVSQKETPCRACETILARVRYPKRLLDAGVTLFAHAAERRSAKARSAAVGGVQ